MTTRKAAKLDGMMKALGYYTQEEVSEDAAVLDIAEGNALGYFDEIGATSDYTPKSAFHSFLENARDTAHENGLSAEDASRCGSLYEAILQYRGVDTSVFW